MVAQGSGSAVSTHSPAGVRQEDTGSMDVDEAQPPPLRILFIPDPQHAGTIDLKTAASRIEFLPVQVMRGRDDDWIARVSHLDPNGLWHCKPYQGKGKGKAPGEEWVRMLDWVSADNISIEWALISFTS